MQYSTDQNMFPNTRRPVLPVKIYDAGGAEVEGHILFFDTDTGVVIRVREYMGYVVTHGLNRHVGLHVAVHQAPLSFERTVAAPKVILPGG